MSDVVEILARALEPWVWSLNPPDISSTAARMRAIERAKSIIASLDAAGWAVVPKEPTDEMVRAMHGPHDLGTDADLATQRLQAACWRAGVLAAPKAIP